MNALFDGEPWPVLAELILCDPPLMYACGRCGAQVGERCVTSGGNLLSPGSSHLRRLYTYQTCDGGVFPALLDTRVRNDGTCGVL